MSLDIRLAQGITIDMLSDEVKSDGLRIWLGGESGSGKSTAAMSIASQAVLQGGQLIVLDAHGEYGALWESRPGGAKAITRFGYGGEPVHEESVDMCLSIVAEGHSLLLDLSHWTDLYPDKLDKWVREFLRGLYELRRREPRQTLLLVEEAANFAPQMQMTGQADNIRIFTAIVTGGRKFGLNFILTAQRQSLVDSNVIAGCNVRLFMRVSEAKDWKKIRQYLPPKLPVTFGAGKKTDLNRFSSGEALVVSRWFKPQRAKLLRPEVELRRYLT